MATVKEQVIESIQALPDDCTMNDIRYLIYVRDRIAEGLADVKAGRVVSQDEADRRMTQLSLRRKQVE